MESLFKKYIEKIRYIKNIRQIYTDSYMEKYEFSYGDERYSVCIPLEFPGKRPVFFATKFKPLLHISFDNNICIDRIEDLNFDINIENYQNILEYYFERFTNVVNAPVPSQEDYLEEYTDYLAYYTNFDMSFYNYVFGSFDTEVVKEIKLYKLKGHSYYFNEEMDITYLLPLNNKTYNKCLFIPMNNYIEIPNSNEISFTYEKFIQFLESGIKIYNPKYNNYKEFLLKMNNLNGFEMYFSVSLARPISETDNRIL